ncbi:PRP1 splicing factor, N-terminal-domain-containing protein [Cantharellus anzutake]|uniref:PRP1 splicing factor, N-terminal-domain-containing protein n=1 Tax=Cantharellus anzutake TaxID=1750568 RepID=UPI001903C84A|nr:PRP1 splicing factor, N-terminal-domain-containing protein [Cantharellus anzutake]KAF8340470.1 PRP1 splicing factor, N-terminal-domain-containing protein [Cantharellus anzutake]
MPPPPKNKLAFLTQQAPASYVAGLGRGASGFTTRSDIGPAREGPSAEVVAEAQARRGEDIDPDPDTFQDPDNEVGLFAGTVYEADDEEADRIYEHVDSRMDERRKARREAREAEERARLLSERPKLQTQFADLKRGLAAVTDTEWENLPEPGNLTGKKRKRDPREGRAFAVPDAILVGDRERGEIVNDLDPRQQQLGGFETPVENSGTLSNLVAIGQARDNLLSLKLDQISGSVNGTSTSIDPKGYLTDLNSVHIKSEAEIGDIKRARMLFDSLVKSNPKHAPGWIAAACVEEHAGRMVQARNIIKKGCEICPTNEDIWLEAARLHNTDDAKVILASAVLHVPQSVKVWLTAANLETESKAKKRVLRKALEQIPNSVTLWKQTISLETSPSDARILLARAVEVLPHSVELWLALARLESPLQAQKVLNKARKAVPTSHEIWIAAGRLVEQNAMTDPAEGELPKSAETRERELDFVDVTIERGTKSLREHGVVLSRDQWLSEAEKCETEGSLRTAQAIVNATISMDVEEEDRVSTWVTDLEGSLARGKVVTARAILAYALRVFPDKRDLWRRAADLEKSHGTRESLEAILSQAVKYCPQSEALWLMSAKEKWMAGDIEGARSVLEAAFDANPENEQIWLAAFKFEAQNGKWAVARQLLERARSVANTERIWMKSVVFEWQQGNLQAAVQTVEAALTKFPKFAKLHMIKGQVLTDLEDIAGARASYANGVKVCPKVPALWILASRLEEADGRAIKSRALLEKARLLNPKEETLWSEAVGLEERASGTQQAKNQLVPGLQECPSSGLLWSQSIWLEARQARKSRSVDALKKSSDHPLVICAVARLFWAEGKVEKARGWFRRVITANTDIGDCWAWWYKFELEHGTNEQRAHVVDSCNNAEPRHGIVWPRIRKAMENLNKTNSEILELVATALE